MSIAAPYTISNEREIQPMQLSIQQLSQLKTQHEEEISDLNKQLETLIGAKNRFLNARSTLAEISTSSIGNRLLIPLNSSLYVPGTIINPDKVIVELGTGYFCEKSVPNAKELVDRKLTLVAKSIESVESVSVNKRKTLEQLVMILQYKVQMAQGKQV